MEQSRQGNLRSLMFPAMGGVLLGAAIVGTLTFVRHQPLLLPNGVTRTPAMIAPAKITAPPAVSAAQNETNALTLYRRTLLAQMRVPLTGHLTVTEMGKRHSALLQIDLTEGTAGRYRMVYRSPQEVAGRTLVSDGKTLYQYEPSRNVVIVRTLPPSSESMWMLSDTGNPTTTSTLPPVSLEITREPRPVILDGRPTDLLTFRLPKTSASPATIRERRWIDEATGRTLCIERYTDNGKLRLRYSLSHVAVTPPTDQVAFQPDFPKTARILRATAPHIENVDALAERLSLPAIAGGLRVRSALALRSIGREMFSGLAGASFSHSSQVRSHHLLYSDGIRSVSVFVSPLPATKSNVSLKPGAGWKSAIPSEHSSSTPTLLTRADETRGSVAVAWLKGGRRYVAIARMPLPHLLPIVYDLYAAR